MIKLYNIKLVVSIKVLNFTNFGLSFKMSLDFYEWRFFYVKKEYSYIFSFNVTLPIPLIYALVILGNILPMPFIYLFARKVLVWGKDKKFIGKFFTFCLNKGEKGGQKLQEKAGKGIYFALFLFVAIPVPGTGAWTGTLAASMLDLDFKKSMIAISLGVIAAGIIMGLGSAGLFTAIKHV